MNVDSDLWTILNLDKLMALGSALHSDQLNDIDSDSRMVEYLDQLTALYLDQLVAHDLALQTF